MDPSPGARPWPSRPAAPVAAALLALLLAAHGPAAAQEPLEAFDQLGSRLRVGDTVVVVDAGLREYKGRLVSLSPSSLTISTRRDQPFAANQVRAVLEPGRPPFRKGLLWGLALGAGAGAAWALLDARVTGMSCPGCVAGQPCGPCEVASTAPNWIAIPLAAGAGALAGLAVSAMLPGENCVVYAAPPPAGRSGPGLALAPILTPRAWGASISISF